MVITYPHHLSIKPDNLVQLCILFVFLELIIGKDHLCLTVKTYIATIIKSNETHICFHFRLTYKIAIWKKNLIVACTSIYFFKAYFPLMIAQILGHHIHFVKKKARDLLVWIMLFFSWSLIGITNLTSTLSGFWAGFGWTRL